MKMSHQTTHTAVSDRLLGLYAPTNPLMATPGAKLEHLWREAEVIALKKGQSLFRAGEPTRHVYRIRLGRVDIQDGTSTRQKQAPIYYVGAGEWLIEAAFEEVHGHTAVCATSCEIQRQAVSQFRARLQDDGALAWALSGWLAKCIGDYRRAGYGHVFTQGDLGGRIVAYVIANADPRTGVFELTYPMHLWAHELGVAPETLSRCLGRLERAERITRLETYRFTTVQLLLKRGNPHPPPLDQAIDTA